MKIKRIDLFTFPLNHQYGVQQSFSEGLQKSLLRLNVQSDLFAYKELGAGQILRELIKNTPDCTAGFSVTVAKHSPLEPLGIPHVSFIVDSATYFPELLQNPDAIMSFVDEDSVSLFKKLGAKRVFCMPHAIDKECFVNIHAMRDLDVVFCGSFIDPDSIEGTWNTLLSQKSVMKLIEIAENVLSSDSLSHLQAFVELVEEHGDFEEELNRKSIDFFDMINSLDQYIRGTDRIRLLQAIDRPVHIFGAIKDKEQWLQKVGSKGIFAGEVPYSDMGGIMQRSKVVLNSFPMFKRGLHERLLLALASGASVVSTDSMYVQRAFGKTGAILPYLSTSYDTVNQMIEVALQDEDTRFANVMATHEILKKYHTWDVRAQMLVDTLQTLLEGNKNNSDNPFSGLF